MAVNLAVAVTNESTVLTDAEVKACLPAFQRQANYHFAPYWHVGATLHFAVPGAIPTGMAHMAVLDDSDQAGALGYHDIDSAYAPTASIFAKTDAQYGLSWTVTFSHELLEILGDQWVAEGWQVGYDWYAQEVGDPVEADELAYKIAYPVGTLPVLVSDFILPRWFMPGSPPKYDFQGHCTKPLQILKGGYMSIFKWGKGWTQVSNFDGTTREKVIGEVVRPRDSQEMRREYAKKEAK